MAPLPNLKFWQRATTSASNNCSRRQRTNQYLFRIIKISSIIIFRQWRPLFVRNTSWTRTLPYPAILIQISYPRSLRIRQRCLKIIHHKCPKCRHSKQKQSRHTRTDPHHRFKRIKEVSNLSSTKGHPTRVAAIVAQYITLLPAIWTITYYIPMGRFKAVIHNTLTIGRGGPGMPKKVTEAV